MEAIRETAKKERLKKLGIDKAEREKIKQERLKKIEEEKARKKAETEERLKKKEEEKKAQELEKQKKAEEDTARKEKERQKDLRQKEEEKKKREKEKRKEKLEKKAWGVYGAKDEGLRNLLDNVPVKDMPQKKLTLQECVDIAIENSLQLEIATKQLKLAKMRVQEAERKLGPTVNLKWEETAGKVNERYYSGRKYMGEYSQPVFHGGEFVFTVGQAKVNKEIVENDFFRVKNELILQVEKAYYSLDKAIKSIKIQEELQKESETYNNITKKGYDLGAINKIEWLNMASKHNQINFQFISAQEDVLLAKLILQQAVNTEEDIDIVLSEDPNINKEISLEDCYSLAFANRPEIRINFLMVEYYLYEKKIMGARLWPKVDFLGSWGYAFEDFLTRDNPEGHPSKFSPEWYAGIKVKLPFWGNSVEYSFTKEVWQPVVSTTHGTQSSTHTTKIGFLDSLSLYSEFTEADIGLGRAQQEYNKTKQEIALEIKENFFKYKKAILQIEVALSKVEYQKRQLDFINTKKELNEAPISNVLEEMVKLSEEEFSLLQAMADYQIALRALNKAIGIPGYF